MKLRFGVDETAYERLRDALDAAASKPPVGKTLTYVYLDTLDDDLAKHGVALRFRRSAALGIGVSPGEWRKQLLWPKGSSQSLKTLGVSRLKQRLDATFTIRIARWTWRPNDWSKVSLDRIAISTGWSSDAFVEMRIDCRKKRHDAAMKLAVGLGATHLASQRIREHGQALLRDERAVDYQTRAASPR